MKKANGAAVYKRIAAAILCLAVFAALFVPAAVSADSGKTVRVGWFESPFNYFDSTGRRAGYSYEYERKIAAYTGWTYEYVEGTWSELMDMLKAGEIDVMSDVSYKEDRTEYMLFPTHSMGTETYYIYVVPEETEIKADDFASLNGKKIGVTKDSIQEMLYLEWAESHGVEAEVVELTSSEDDSLRLMRTDVIDAFLTVDSYGDPETNTPVFKVGSSDFYFAVTKNRPDILGELEAALSRIQDENRYYNEQLFEKYLRKAGADLYLSADELAWLSDHGTIRVGYQNNYLAFCASDENGDLTGALKDYLEYAETCLENAELDFEAIAFPTAAAAMEALKKGEIDCVFPANFTDHDSEAAGLVMSPPIMRTEMDAVVRASEQKEFVKKQDVVVAVNEGNPNYDLFLEQHYPGWSTIHYVDTPTCLDAVAAGEADCVIISNYRFNNISKQCEKLHLTTVYTGVDMDYCLAVRQGEVKLYSIISRAIDGVPDSIVNSALTYYSTEDAKTGFVEFIKDNLAVVGLIVGVIIVIILVLLIRSIVAEKKVDEDEKILDTLNKRVFVDALTSVRNKGSFNDYIQELQDRLDNGEALEFAVGVFDCDNLKKINDRHGHDKGDEYLKAAAQLICRTFRHSPVFRIGGDEFAVILMNEDYVNRDELVAGFEASGREHNEGRNNEWEYVSVALGIAVYDPSHDRSVNETARRADRIMYENKRLRKEHGHSVFGSRQDEE
ncbi:MAG: transporter substrate-binding domain-containing protein [Clostridia bacterium]|nr:transporter substrate-binding domain-containing protein [Clostridia bacterium]